MVVVKKAPGPDGITNEMLKHLGPGAKRFLLRIYNQSWSTGIVPTIKKEALIRPIKKQTNKGKDKRDPSNYRPISQLSCVGKLPERIINKRLTWQVKISSSFDRDRLSTARRHRRQTGSLDVEYRRSLPSEEEGSGRDFLFCFVLFVFGFWFCFVVLFCFGLVWGVFLLSKAFDKVWKEGLLLKLLRAGVHGKMYRWLQ